MLMINNNISYVQAYTEVNCLLESLPRTYVYKLPQKLIDFIKGESNQEYNIDIDINKSLLEQNFSQKAKDLIAVLKYNYWSTEEEKKQLESIFKENENKHQEELLKKYDSNNIFNKKEIYHTTEITEKEKNIALYNKNTFVTIFKKIKNKILSFFKNK